MKLAIAQVAPKLGDLQANLDRTRGLVQDAVSAGAMLVVFPELSLSGYLSGDHDRHLALPATDHRLAEAASNAGGAAVLLCFPEMDDGVSDRARRTGRVGPERHGRDSVIDGGPARRGRAMGRHLHAAR